ncbi:MAG: hypothetical protein RLN75_06870, partial [Longimicrobiales bacterium]
ELDPEAAAKHWMKDPEATANRLEAVLDALQAGPWDEGSLEERLRARAEELGVGAGKVIHPLRLAVTGRGRSPGIFDVLVVLGEQRVRARVERALARLRAPDVSLS